LFRETFHRIESVQLRELYQQGLLSKTVEAMALELDGPGDGAQSTAVCERLPLR
jgi:hypothetical protein